MSSVKELMKEAAFLNKKELSDLVAKLQALLGVSGGSVATVAVPNGVAEEMYSAMADAMMQLRKIKARPIFALKKSKHWKNFQEAAAEADNFLSMLEKGRTKKHSLRRYSCQLILMHLRQHGMGWEWGAIAWGMNNISDIFDQQFPGYLASGLMPLVLESLYNKGAKPFRDQ